MFFSNIKRIGYGLFGILFLIYPFLIFYISPFYIILALITLTLLRASMLFIGKKETLTFQQKSTVFIAIGVASVTACLYFCIGDVATFYYPVVMSLTMALVFAMTLIYPPSMIERFARLSTPNLEPSGVIYTRNVTILWTCYCLMNAIISFITIHLNNIEMWTLYNGCISYILMGLLFAGEYAYRKYHLYSKKDLSS